MNSHPVRRWLPWAAVIIAVLAPWSALAGGVGRPNAFGPMGLGLGGAGFAGVPDPSTIHYNPAGMSLSKVTTVMGSFDMVWVPRRYEPLSGSPESTVASPIPSGAFGFSTSFAKRDGRDALPFSVGVAFHSPFGGALTWPKDEVATGVISSSILDLELVAAAAYQVASGFTVGAGVRIGFLAVSVETNDRGVDRAPAKLSGSGVGVGAILGATYQATSFLRIGLVYGSQLSAEASGVAHVQRDSPDDWWEDNFRLALNWPQWLALGVALDLGEVGLYAGIKWTDWSAWREIAVRMTSQLRRDQANLDDGVSGHLGATWWATPWLQLRAGVSVDSNTVPDEALGRQFFDLTKFTAGAAVSLRVARSFFIDVGYEATIGLPREVSDVVVAGKDGPVHLNPSPGQHSWFFHAPTAGLRYRY